METLTTTKLSLVEGTFNTAEAREVLLTLIDDKIRFHNNRIFSHEERFGITPSDSVDRITQLTKTRKEIVDIMNKCKDQDCEIRIHSDINIEIK